MKLQNMLMAALLVSALVLTGLLLITGPQSRVVYGETLASGDDYTLLATARQAGGEENLVTIIDGRRQRTITYVYTGGKLNAVVSEDLSKWFK